ASPTSAGSVTPTLTLPTVTRTVHDPNATPTPSPYNPTATPPSVRFQQIEDQIFSVRCATQYCHSQQAKAANMILEPAAADPHLVGAEPTTVAPRNHGMLRVDPTHPDNSFLIFKLTQPNSTTFGSRMPLGGTPLSQAEIDAIREWILGGA